MPTTDNNQAHLRHLPKVHALLECEQAKTLLTKMPRPVVLDAVRAEIDALRQRVLAGDATPPFPEADLFAAVERRLHDKD